MSQLSFFSGECPECGGPLEDPVMVDDIAFGLDGPAILICQEHLDEFPGDFRRVD